MLFRAVVSRLEQCIGARCDGPDAPRGRGVPLPEHALSRVRVAALTGHEMGARRFDDPQQPRFRRGHPHPPPGASGRVLFVPSGKL